MIIGYARVSTFEQNLDLQIDELTNYGCKKIFTDKISGGSEERVGLNKCLNTIKEGDILIVWDLSRLGRNFTHLIEMVNSFKDKGIKFKSLKEGVIDTTTASGELVFNIFAALAQFSKARIKERTLAGLNAARARGKKGGRPKMNQNDPKIITAKKLHQDKTIPIKDICGTLKISKATLYRYLKT